MSEFRLGIPARVMFAHAPSGRELVPERVEHLQFGITWDVTGILDSWQHPGRAEDTLGKPVLIKWWLLKVSGPLPGRPAKCGEFLIGASFYGDPPGWWITIDLLTAWLARPGGKPCGPRAATTTPPVVPSIAR